MADITPVTAGSTVTLHFSLALAGGQVIDSNYAAEPASFRLGDGSMLPGFEEQLLGLEPGMSVEVVLAAAEAFGEVNQQNVHRIPKDRFTLFLEDEFESLEEGTVVSFKDPAGFDLPGVVKEKYDTVVVIDFNHPLAGKDIVFKAHVIAVIADDTDKLEIKL